MVYGLTLLIFFITLRITQSHTTLLTLNLGTGAGHSVLEIVKTFEKVSGRVILYKIGPRRAGDIAKCWADTTLAQQLLNWKISRGLEKMCADSWRWQQGALSYLQGGEEYE